MSSTNQQSSRVALVWRNLVLNGSETFIRNQTSAMQEWTPLLTGAAASSSVLSRADDKILYGTGRVEWLRRKFFRLVRRSSRLQQHLRENNVSLVHAHFGPDAITIHPTARRAKLPLIVTFHGYDVTTETLLTGFEGWRYRRRIRQAMAYSSRIIAVSDFIADQAINRLGADPNKLVVHRIGIPIGEELVKSSAAPEWDLVFVGRLTAKKGIEHLLRAVAALQPSHRSCTLAIVGSGRLREELEVLATELNINVTFLGRRTPDEIRAILGNSRIFVGPSRTAPSGDAEGFGMVFLEAALASLPVVAYRHGGVTEAVEDGVTGLLAPENDVEALSAHVEYLLSNPEIAASMGRAGRARVIQDFDVQKQTALLESIYDDVAAYRNG